MCVPYRIVTTPFYDRLLHNMCQLHPVIQRITSLFVIAVSCLPRSSCSSLESFTSSALNSLLLHSSLTPSLLSWLTPHCSFVPSNLYLMLSSHLTLPLSTSLQLYTIFPTSLLHLQSLFTASLLSYLTSPMLTPQPYCCCACIYASSLRNLVRCLFSASTKK